jgi:hypothetical protein
MDSNLSKIMAMVNGQDRNDFDLNTVSSENRAKIDDAIESVFVGKSTLIWANGGKLIDAWNAALDDLRDELFRIPNTSPTVAYLRQAVFYHRTHWQQKMLQSNERNSVAYFKNNDEKSELVDHAKALVSAGLNTIRDIIDDCSGNGARNQKFDNSHDMTHTKTMVHARERSYERTRKK